MSAKKKTKKKAPEFDFDKFRGDLAKLEHEQWTSWAYGLMQEEKLSAKRRKRWTRLMESNWEDLTDEDTVADYEFADIVLKVLADDAFNNLVLIAEYILDGIYPENLFTGTSGDIGVKFIVALREALREVKEVTG